MKQDIALLNPEQFAHFWPSIEHELDRVPHIWAMTWTKASLFEAVMGCKVQAWALITDEKLHLLLFSLIAVYPANRVLEIGPMLGNHLHESADLIDATMERFAEAQECTLIRVVGRPGLERFMKRFEMKKCEVVLTRAVGKRRMN